MSIMLFILAWVSMGLQGMCILNKCFNRDCNMKGNPTTVGDIPLMLVVVMLCCILGPFMLIGSLFEYYKDVEVKRP